MTLTYALYFSNVLHLLTYGPKLLAIKKHSTLSQTVPAMFHQAETLHHTLAVTMSQEHQLFNRQQCGTPVTPCGMVCSVHGGHEALCCVSASMPWFTKNKTTTATINECLCLDEDTNNENIRIEHLELYIK